MKRNRRDELSFIEWYDEKMIEAKEKSWSNDLIRSLAGQWIEANQAIISKDIANNNQLLKSLQVKNNDK